MRVKGEEMQERILGVLSGRETPASAYDVLDILRRETPKLAPTTIYRALAALVERGRVHRLESLNAYTVCQGEAHRDAPVLAICDDCGSVAEAVSRDVLGALSGIARQSGFSPTRHVIELHGTCATCEDAGGRA